VTQIEILKKAIAKANSSITFDLIVSPDFDWDWFCRDEYRKIIFRHDFAKAFFGEQPEYGIEWWTVSDEKFQAGDTYIDAWQYHLQQIVLEADPLSYLAKFLE